MKQKRIKYLPRTPLFLLLVCLFAVGVLISTGWSGGAPMQLQSKSQQNLSNQDENRQRPELDLRVPESTEFALFALG